MFHSFFFFSSFLFYYCREREREREELLWNVWMEFSISVPMRCNQQKKKKAPSLKTPLINFRRKIRQLTTLRCFLPFLFSLLLFLSRQLEQIVDATVPNCARSEGGRQTVVGRTSIRVDDVIVIWRIVPSDSEMEIFIFLLLLLLLFIF